jgi:creatine kinase
LSTLEGDLKGDYYPLAGSNTYEPKPNGIHPETEKRLIGDHFLFQAPDDPMLRSLLMELDLPHSLGIYHNEAKSALVWVNEEDHLRIISIEKGNNIRAVFDRFGGLVKAVEAACKEVGRGLEISDDEYGNMLSCPSNCGTGLRASMMIKIPLASKQEGFKEWCAARHLQARGSGGFASAAADDGIRDVSNVDCMGKDEVKLVNEMIEGVTALIAWEKELEAPEPPADDGDAEEAVAEEDDQAVTVDPYAVTDDPYAAASDDPYAVVVEDVSEAASVIRKVRKVRMKIKRRVPRYPRRCSKKRGRAQRAARWLQAHENVVAASYFSLCLLAATQAPYLAVACSFASFGILPGAARKRRNNVRRGKLVTTLLMKTCVSKRCTQTAES